MPGKKGKGKGKGKGKDGTKKDEDEIRLIEGSEYEVQSLGSRENPLVTKGIFRGYTMVGIHAEALCIELGSSHKKFEGKIRVLPSHMILAIDIIKEGEEEEDEEEDSPLRSYM
jgi:hypothetical protein